MTPLSQWSTGHRSDSPKIPFGGAKEEGNPLSAWGYSLRRVSRLYEPFSGHFDASRQIDGHALSRVTVTIPALRRACGRGKDLLTI